MVLPPNGPQEEHLPHIEDNFYLGRPDFKFSTSSNSGVSKFETRRKLWLFKKQLLQQETKPPWSPPPPPLARPRPAPAAAHLNFDLVSSTSAQKTTIFRRSLTKIMSCLYAVFIVTFGTVIYLGDVLAGKTLLAEIFSLYLVTLGLAYFVFLYVDIRIFLARLKSKETPAVTKDTGVEEEEVSRKSWESRGQNSVTWTSFLEADLCSPQSYSFNETRHGGSFYLKVGAAGFCLGHLVHSGLLLFYQTGFLLTDPENFHRCSRVTTLLLDSLHPTYSFFQLYFIFKYSNVRINRFKVVGRFAVMHCIGSSLCFWLWTILRETKASLNLHPSKEFFYKRSHNQTYDMSVAMAKASHGCQEPKRFRVILENFSPYLYPFTIEYSILVAGVLLVIWQNIGSYDPFSLMRKKEGGCGRGAGGSSLVLHADCHSSNKGLFAGFIVLAGAFLSIILFLVTMADRKYTEVGVAVSEATELVLVTLMTAAVLLAYRKIVLLDLGSAPRPLLDLLLLFLCFPGFLLHALLSLLPLYSSASYLALANVLLQATIQIPFIAEGLGRCSNGRGLRERKPGRELLTFLVVCNLALWITQTFQMKSHSEPADPRSLYYGRLLWTSLSHLTFPLMMFYRFHSSVCIVDIWKIAYLRGL